ncbi:hypothetical protein CONLIGDRAFT_557427, partial [Coniochaeta ligniaria NRRL 30616]
LDNPTLDRIVQHIVDVRRRNTQVICTFDWPADQIDTLFSHLAVRLHTLGEDKVRHTEYDYRLEKIILYIMQESRIHYQVKYGLDQEIRLGLMLSMSAIQEVDLRLRAKAIIGHGTASIHQDGRILRQADCSFGHAESRKHVEEKAVEYISCTQGDIQAVLILDLKYPKANMAFVSLYVPDASPGNVAGGRWVLRRDVFYGGDGLSEQPDGQVDLYLSDFLGHTGLPTALCRPSGADLDAGITRTPHVILTYDRLREVFLQARSIHAGILGPSVPGPESLYQAAARRVGEQAERRHTEEMNRRIAEEREE